MSKDVTDNQGLNFARMARAKGVSRQQLATAEENGTVGRFLDGLRDGLPITIGIPLIPPPGGRVHIVKVRKLRIDREWQKAINGAGPNTSSGSSVRKVGDLYLPTGTGVVEEEEHILLDYPNGDGVWYKALSWAARFRLMPNDPRRVFGMAEQKPNLHRDLGMDPMCVVAPVGCTFDDRQRACCSWWIGTEREAGLLVRPRGWFSFRKYFSGTTAQHSRS